MSNRARVFLFAFAALFAATPAATAEMIVLESNVAEYPAGARLPDDWVLALPSGGRVRVLLGSQETKVFVGPRAEPPPGPTGATTAVPSLRSHDPIGATRGERNPK